MFDPLETLAVRTLLCLLTISRLGDTKTFVAFAFVHWFRFIGRWYRRSRSLVSFIGSLDHVFSFFDSNRVSIA